ncbi:effector-associated domain EAD1-containing protein [Streptomyces canus]|uniref:effector-associated domain EAD1-containing protein n=1 Tax=Streptomyces canus TaxID=58343 RepID=UPI0030E16F7E
MDERTHFVDRFPFDWSLRESQELRDLLATSYFRPDPVIQMAAQADIELPSVQWHAPMTTVWHNLITAAHGQNKLRALLDQVEAGPDQAVAFRVRELLSRPVATGAAEPPADQDGAAREAGRETATQGTEPYGRGGTAPAVEARTPAARLPTLQAYRMPLNWYPDGDPCPIGDAYLADLGARLCLDRGPTTTVVAARTGTAWAEALTALEQGAIRHGSGSARDFPERVWLGVQADGVESGLRNRPVGTATPGLVVSWPVDASLVGRSAREVLDRIRAAAPDAPVVLSVEAEQAVDAIAAATRIGRELAAGRTGAPVEVFAHSRPGDPGDGVPVTALDTHTALNTHTDLDPHRLMATVAAQMRGRSLPVPPYPFDGVPLTDSADPTAVAAAVVAMLNRSAPWGLPDREAHAIGLVRDYAPRYFLSLLRHHAATRTGPAHWSSLFASAAVDDHVTVWLECAHTVGSPSRIPRTLRARATVEAVLLGLLRSGADTAQAWAATAADRCPAACEVAEFLAAGRPAAEFLPSATAEAAVAAARAGKYDLLTAVIEAPEGCAAWWAALGCRPLTERTVATLAALSVESRRIPGFTLDPRESDADFAELTDQMRLAMRPPLPVREATR